MKGYRYLKFFMVLVIFFTNSFLFAEDFEGPVIPFELGRVCADHEGAVGKPLVIVIQNLPCNPYVQENIYDILLVLKHYYKNDIKIVGIEGDVGYIDTSIIGNISDDILKEKIIDGLLSEDKITGSEAFSAMEQGEVSLYGLEDWTVYSENIGSLKEGVLRENGWEIEYRDCIGSLEKLKNSLGSHLKDVVDIKDFYDASGIDLGEYVKHLVRLYLENHKRKEFVKKYRYIDEYIKILNLKDSINIDLVYQDRLYCITNIEKYVTKDEHIELLVFSKEDDYEHLDKYLRHLLAEYNITIKKSYKNLYKYFSYLDAVNTLDRTKLNKEIDILELDLMHEFAETDFEKDVVFMYINLEMLKNCILNRMTYFEYMHFIKDKEKLLALLKKYFGKDSIDKIIEKLEVMEQFYDGAIKRSSFLIPNLLQYRSHVFVIVVGGFYNDLIISHLRAMGCSYINVLPKIKYDEDSKYKYLSRLYGKIINYDSPVITSCLYTKEFRMDLAEIVNKEILNIYQLGLFDEKGLKDSLAYALKLSIENDMEKDFIELIAKLVENGYNAGYSFKNKKRIIEAIANDYGVDKKLI